MPTALVLGGTRQIGRALVLALHAQGWRVLVANRGVSADDLPSDVVRIRADRDVAGALARALAPHEAELVIDCTAYTGVQAREAATAMLGRTARFVLVSTGQVYLVGAGAPALCAEHEDARPLVPAPSHPWHLDQWRYGVHKREAEAAVQEAAGQGLPASILRIPMVHGPRDPYERCWNYLWRARDGGLLVLPDDAPRGLRHVHVDDVVQAILSLARTPSEAGRAWNLAPRESLALDDALHRLAAHARTELTGARLPRAALDERALLPACAPFSSPWMSVLDGSALAAHLGWWPRPCIDTLDALWGGLAAAPPSRPPASAPQRAQERELVPLATRVDRFGS
ncbi:MAG: NAD-dependent epimerase/dehydratase family protein [Gemmatimonadaceae bacterium]|nr:NAD-dependent epimerase/dehydratase family protein [Gemmatimonadaceae bacterium]